MSDEVNKMLEGKWFVVDAMGAIHIRGDEDTARALCVTWDAQYPSAAPHHTVQLQVKGTLPEGAIMPKYKVGDRVTFNGTRVFRVKGVKIVYSIESLCGNYGCGTDESSLKFAPPADPMRDEFEALAAKQKCDISRLKDQSDKYTSIYTQGMWRGYQAAKAGAK